MEMIKLFAAKGAGENGKPGVLKEEKDYLLLYKPPLMHSAGLKGSETSLSRWCASLFPETAKIHGWKEGEGGLLHRLDYDTRGLVLFARNQFFFDFLVEQQKKNLFKKEYIARCKKSAEKKAGFPPFPFDSLRRGHAAGWGGVVDLSSALFPLCIESAFRPYGKGRKEVRPVIASSPIGKHKELAFDGGLPYKTELLQKKQRSLDTDDNSGGQINFRIRLCRGFRHQIRCHLAWAGFPLLNDPVYGIPGSALEETDDTCLALEAAGLSFPDPYSGKELNFFISEAR